MRAATQLKRFAVSLVTRSPLLHAEIASFGCGMVFISRTAGAPFLTARTYLTD
jgi:hypothetical protein